MRLDRPTISFDHHSESRVWPLLVVFVKKNTSYVDNFRFMFYFSEIQACVSISSIA